MGQCLLTMGETGQVELMKQAFRYQNALVSYAYGQLRDWSLAEDAVQDAFCVLLEKWQEYNPEFGVFPWARKMVYYKVQEILRSRRKEVPVQDEELCDLVCHTLEEHFDEEAGRRHDPMIKAYQECMSKLGKESSELLSRYYFQSQSSEKIAAVLKRSVNAVWLSLSRIRKALRSCISRRHAELGVAP